MNFFILNCLIFFILYSQKYPDFINYVDQELQEMKCCVCAVDMEKIDLLFRIHAAISFVQTVQLN